ncbi:MAG: hypothetical protein Q4Q62_04865 [Thermoplasmata archaeon]|nr:hypothetical protein [Thermoplasmata archaeon]
MAGLLRDSDKLRLQVFAVCALAGIALAIALPLVFDGIGYSESSVMLAAPIVALGVCEMVLGRSWVRLAVSAAVCVVLLVPGWMYGAAAAMLLFGAQGCAVVSDLMQRRWALSVLDSAESQCVRPEPTRTDRVVSFVFDLPRDLDTRNMKIRGSIRRESIPWRQIAESMLPMLVLMLLVWVVIASIMGSRHTLPQVMVPVLVISLYAAAVTMPLGVFASMDARAETAGRTLRLSEGMARTTLRMAVPAAVAVVIVILVAQTGTAEILAIAASAVFCVLLRTGAALLYGTAGEPEFVSDAYAEWSRTHPADLYSGLDGRGSEKGMGDGVPGTPRRPADFCYGFQK